MEKKSGWINIYNEHINIEKQENSSLQSEMTIKPSSIVYPSKEDAMKHITSDIDDYSEKYIDTVMIEWEEKEVSPKYKTGDMVIPKIHHVLGDIYEGFPVEVVGSVVYPDKKVFYQLKGLEYEDIPESEIIRKVS